MRLGNTEISSVKLGSSQVQAVYLGNTIVWQNAPVATAATGVGSTSFTANWNAYTGAVYYLLDVSTSSSFTTFVYENEPVIAPSTSYVVIGLEPNTTYYYRVRASNEVAFISATGGTITYAGDYKIHTFTTSGTFDVTDAGVGQTAEVLVVAGGGGGGSYSGGGGGAGGLLYAAAKSFTVQAYTVTIGSGGARPNSDAGGNTNGNDTTFDNLTAIGGGRGGVQNDGSGKNGGSGGGATGGSLIGGTGTTGQGNNGGGANTSFNSGSGGGGAGAVGQNAGIPLITDGGDGGNGLSYSISGVSTFYAGGGGGSGAGTFGVGGNGGGGAGEKYNLSPAAQHGAANTGGGGGGMYLYSNSNGSNGGSGIVIIRYKYK